MVVILIIALIIRISIKKKHKFHQPVVSIPYIDRFFGRTEKLHTSRTEKTQHRPDFL